MMLPGAQSEAQIHTPADSVPAAQGAHRESRPAQILRLAVYAGETLLESGGEIFRVQDTMERIAKSYGQQDFHVYVLTNGLFAAVDGCGQALRSIPQASTHIGRIMAVNALSREIAAGGVSPEQALDRLREIRTMPKKSASVRLLACAVGTAAFAYLFGGTWVDAAAAFLAGLALEPLRLVMERFQVGKFVANLLGAALVALVSLLCAAALGALGVPCSLDAVIIGGIIPLVPGIALTTGIRDAAGGDYLSGAIRAIDALLIAAAIACGVGFVLKLADFLPGVVV